MALRKYKPITAGTRWRIGNAYAEITSDTPEKSLLEKVKSTAGRNVQGRRAMRYMGGGHKKMYRVIDFKRSKKGIPAQVASIEYDPYRTAFIALLTTEQGCRDRKSSKKPADKPSEYPGPPPARQ